MNFDNAWQFCKNHTAQLILVKDPDENEKINTFLSILPFYESHEIWLSYRYIHDGMYTFEKVL